MTKQSHCQHDPDPAGITPADGAGRNRGTDWIIDVPCRHCGRSGSLRIDPAAIDFDDDDVCPEAPICPGCGSTLTDRTTVDGRPSYCDVCDREVGEEEEAKPADDRDPVYERAAARARGNDFKDTGGRDWT